MFKVASKECNQCLFTENRIVESGRLKEIVKACQKRDVFFECHKASIAGEHVCCRGYYDRFDFQVKQIAERLGRMCNTNFIEFVDVEKL